MLHSRRGFLTGLVGFVAAPAVCKAEWLMPVKAIIKPEPFEVFNARRLSRIHYDALRRYAKWQRELEAVYGSRDPDMGIYKVYGTPLGRP